MPIRQMPREPIKEREEIHARPSERVSTQAVAQPDVQVLNLLKGQMERQVSETEKQRTAIEKYHEDLQQQKDEYTRQMSAIVEKLQQLDAYKEEMKPEDFRKLQSDIMEQRSFLESQKLSLTTIEQDLAHLKEIDFENYTYQEKQVLQKLATEIMGLKSTLTASEDRVTSIDNAVKSYREDFSALKENADRYEQEISTLRASLDVCTAEAERAEGFPRRIFDGYGAD